MSGGSWEYLCYALERGEDILGKAPLVRSMADHLVDLGYEPEAREMYRLALRLDQARFELEERWRALEAVMHGVEWYDSADYGEDTLRRVMEERRVGHDAVL